MKKETYNAIEGNVTWKHIYQYFIEWTNSYEGRGNSKLTLYHIYGEKAKDVKLGTYYFRDFCNNLVDELKREVKSYNKVVSNLLNLNDSNIISLDNIRYLNDITANILFYGANPVFRENSSYNYIVSVPQNKAQLIYNAVNGYVSNMETAEDVFFAKETLTSALKTFKCIFTADQMINITKKLFEILPTEFDASLIAYIDFDKAANNRIKNEFLAELFDYYVFKGVEIDKESIEIFLNSINNESSLSDKKIQDLINKFFLQKGFSALVEYDDTSFVKKYFEEIFKNYITHTTDFSNDIQILSQYKFDINYLDNNTKETFTNRLIKIFEENRITSDVLEKENEKYQSKSINFSNDTTNLSITGNANTRDIYSFLPTLNKTKKNINKKEIEKVTSINNLLCLDFLGSYNESIISKELLENYLNKKLLENNLNVKDIIALSNLNVKNIKLDKYFNEYLKSENVKLIKDFSLKETNEVLKNFMKNCSQETFTLFSEKLLLELQKESNDKVILNFLSQTNDFKAHKQLKSFFEEKISQEYAIKKYFSGIKSDLIDYNNKTYFCKLNWKNIINKYIDSANKLDNEEIKELFDIIKYDYISGLNNKAFLLKAFDKLEKGGASLDDTIYFNEAIGVDTSSIIPELKEKIKEKLFAASIDEYVNLKRTSSVCTFMRLNFTDEEKLKFFEKFFKDENIVSLSKKGSIKTILESITENAPIRYDLMTTTDGINFHNKYFYKFFANNLNNFIASGKANEKDYVPTIDVVTYTNVLMNSFGVAHVLKDATGGAVSQYDASTEYDYKLLNTQHIANNQDFKDYYIRKTLNLLIPVFNTKENINFQIKDSNNLIIITNDKENLIAQKRINAKDEDKAIISNKDETLFVEIFPSAAAIKKPGISLFEKTEINKCENKVLENLANHYIDITENFLERMQYENEQNKFKEKVSEIISTLDFFADEFSDLKTEILTDGLDENTVFVPYIDKISAKIEDVTNYILNGKNFDNKTNIKIENIFNDSLPIIKKAVSDYTVFLSTKNENTSSDLKNEMDQLLKTFIRYSDSVIFKIDDVLNNEMEWNARDINASMRVRTIQKESDFTFTSPKKEESCVTIKPSSENKIKVENAVKENLDDLASIIEKERKTNLCIQKLAQIITAPEDKKEELRHELYTDFSDELVKSITPEMIMNYLDAKREVEFSKINDDLNKN